ncbi:hypothetical protein [Kosmotoga olearia]|uniref:hypothetical protein n=1 Tax=Kosmotoga olearia TaxID=651457 RepID=UPI0011D15356|nr:hypothetical protein [Kosmotoga olearia]
MPLVLLKRQTKKATSMVVTIPRYNKAKMELVFHNPSKENGGIFCSDAFMSKWMILQHLS